jgi:heat shock protein HslJ
MILMLAMFLGAHGCATMPQGDVLVDREWSFAWMDGVSSIPRGVAVPSIRFGSDGRLGGNTGCNSAGAAYAVEGDRLTISSMFTTKRACADPAGNEIERKFVAALERTRRFRIAGGELELLDDGGTVLARFAYRRG